MSVFEIAFSHYKRCFVRGGDSNRWEDSVYKVAGRAGFEYHPLNGGARLSNKKPLHNKRVFSAGMAGGGFEYHPLNGGARPSNKKPLIIRDFSAGRAGFEPATGLTRHSLSRRAHSATLAPPQLLGSSDFYLASRTWTVAKAVTTDEPGGGSGIRTHVGVTQTCFQDMRLQPLGHPSRRKRFYHRVGIIETHD